MPWLDLAEALLILASLALIFVICEIKVQITRWLSLRRCAAQADADTVLETDRRVYAGDVSGIPEEEAQLAGQDEEDCPGQTGVLYRVPQVV